MNYCSLLGRVPPREASRCRPVRPVRRTMQEDKTLCAGCILFVCSILSGYLQYSSLFSAVPLVALPPAVPVSSAAHRLRTVAHSSCLLSIFLMDPIWTIFRFKKVHYYLVPLVALVVWWGMLTAMLICWGVQGRPVYSFMDEKQNPVYISDVGATNLQPLFISCAGFQAIFFVGSLIMDFVLRKKHKLQPFVLKRQPKLAIASIVCAIIGQLGILFVAIFNTNAFHRVHISMVGVFIAFCFFACLFNFFNSFIFGNYPHRLSPNHEKVIFSNHRWGNLYMVSFWFKCFWLVCAAVFACFFGAYMKKDKNSKSAVFEWLISYWYGLLLVMWSMDLFPSAVKHYRVRHPEKFEDVHVKNELDDAHTILTLGAPTYSPPPQPTDTTLPSTRPVSGQDYRGVQDNQYAAGYPSPQIQRYSNPQTAPYNGPVQPSNHNSATEPNSTSAHPRHEFVMQKEEV